MESSLLDDLFSEYNPNLKPTEMPGSKIAIDLQVEIDQVLVKVKNERIKFSIISDKLNLIYYIYLINLI